MELLLPRHNLRALLTDRRGDLIANDWFQMIATYNPVSYLVEAFRSLLIDGWDGEALALGFGFALVILAGGMWAATAALRTRMERT